MSHESQRQVPCSLSWVCRRNLIHAPSSICIWWDTALIEVERLVIRPTIPKLHSLTEHLLDQRANESPTNNPHSQYARRSQKKPFWARRVVRNWTLWCAGIKTATTSCSNVYMRKLCVFPAIIINPLAEGCPVAGMRATCMKKISFSPRLVSWWDSCVYNCVTVCVFFLRMITSKDVVAQIA